VLLTITARKALHLRRDVERPKRGGGVVLGEAELRDRVDAGVEEAGLEQVVGREPTPAFAALVAEECRRLLSRLEDAALQALALLKMEGYTNDEIASRLGCERVTVQRKLRLIRTLWKEEGGP
jgi:DNA-directed RNA polymerase specialized sigma24 family protein